MSSPKSGRYQRSTAGLIGAMVVLLLVIVAFVAFRSLVREDLDVEPETVDYLDIVEQVQDAGVSVYYPADLPRDWRATSATYDPASGGFGLGLNTSDGTYVGLRQEDADLSSLLVTYVDDDAHDEGQTSIPDSPAPEWRAWSDDGGDHAFSAEIDGTQVLIYGSASEDQLRDFAASLTDRRR